MAQFVSDQSGDSNFFHDMVDESSTNIDRFVPSVIEHVSSEAISALQAVPGVAIEVGNGEFLDTASGFLKQVSCDAISVAQGVTTEVQHVGAFGETEMEQVSSEALSATEKEAAGLASDVRHGVILSTATGLIKDMSSQAISAAQGVATKLKHGEVVEEETSKLKYLAFVQVAIFYLVLLFINLYTNLKQKSRLLKPVLEIIERIVKPMLRTIFDKLFDSLYKKLKFVDDKVDELVTKIDRLVPSIIKQDLSKFICAARNALGMTVDVHNTSGFLEQISSGIVPSAGGVASSQVQHSELIPEELQMLMYLKYFKYFVILQIPVLRLRNLYFRVKKLLGALKPVIDIAERVVISLYHKFFADMVKSQVKWVLIKFFGVPAEIFDIIDKVGNLNKIAELSKLGNFSKFNALGKVEDVSRLGDLSNLGDMSNVGDLSKFGSLSKIDALIPSGMKMVSSGVTSAAENLPEVTGSATEMPGLGAEVLSTAVEFFKQAPSNAITGFQVMADVQHAKAATKIDSLVAALSKQASSVATSVTQNASGMTGSGASEVQHTARVGSIGSGLIAVTRRSPKVQHPTVVNALAKSFFHIVDPKIKKCAISVWHKLDRIPLVPRVASVVNPTVALFAKKHKKTVATGATKGFKVASVLPLVPTRKIAKRDLINLHKE